MSKLIDSITSYLYNKLEERRVQVAYTGSPSFSSHLRGLATKAGATMDEEKALGLAVVYACVSKISGTIASLNLGIYERDGANKIKAVGHPAYKLISEEPEPNLTAFNFWEVYVSNVLIYGKAYAIIRRLPNGEPYELCLVHPSRVTIKDVEGEEVYVIKDEGSYLPESILHTRNLYGKSPVELNRDLLGLAKAVQDFSAEFFASSGNMTGILSSNEPLTKEQIDVIKDSWNNSGDSLGTKLLPFGFKYERIGVAPESAQVKEQLDYLNQEICRLFGVPPSIVGVASNQTYSNTEQQAISFSKQTIVPLVTKLEQEINLKLIARDERERIYSKFDLSDMLRGDSASRASYYDTLVKAGIMSINEVRRLENLNPVDGGDEHTIQVNQISLSALGAYSEKVSSDV